MINLRNNSPTGTARIVEGRQHYYAIIYLKADISISEEQRLSAEPPAPAPRTYAGLTPQDISLLS